MGHFLDIAYRVLLEENRPLSPLKITEIGRKNGWLITKGKTPEESMRARLSKDILDKKGKSLFMRTSSGTFGLRLWLGNELEYVAPRFKKSLLEEDIVVFPSTLLEKYVKGRGLYIVPPKDRRRMIAELQTMRRNIAEDDFSVIQLISAFIIRFKNKYLTYKRTKRLPERRLHGYYSIPFGGHLNPNDIDLPLFNDFTDPDHAILMFNREFEEELILPDNKKPELVYKGLLYDDQLPVSRQHLGVVYDVYLDSDKYSIGERGFLMDPKFETLEEIENRKKDFENWSWIIMEFERKINRKR